MPHELRKRSWLNHFHSVKNGQVITYRIQFLKFETYNPLPIILLMYHWHYLGRVGFELNKVIKRSFLVSDTRMSNQLPYKTYYV